MTTHELLTGLLSYALQSGLLLAAGLIAPRFIRLNHPRSLLAYWRILLLTVVVLPLVTAIWQPRSPLPILTLNESVVEEVVATTLPGGISSFSSTVVLTAVAAVAIFGLIRIALGLLYLDRCRRTATAVDPLPDHVAKLQRRLGLEVPFVIARALSVPLTFGWARPIVMVPASFNNLSADEQEGVACHELLHIRRRDWPVTLIEELIRAALWFHPAVWLLMPRISLSREQVVDAGTVAITGKRRQYLDALWSVVVACQNPPLAIAVPMIGRSHLRARVDYLKKEIAMSRTRIAASLAVLWMLIAAVGIVGANVFPVTGAVSGDHFTLGKPWSSGDEKGGADGPQSTETMRPLETLDPNGECREITHPEVVEKVQPKYPEEARKAKIMGEVILRSVISETGEVEDLEVVDSPDDSLTEAAVDAVKQWRFKPALCDGEPAGVYYNLTVRFHLK